MNKFDDIPDHLLKDILSRLVCKIEHVFQCKCVSKRWLHVISSPDFIGHCISIQRDDLLQTPATLATLVIFNRFKANDHFLSSQNPFFTSRKRNFLLDFLPCYKNLKGCQKLARTIFWPIPQKPGDLVPPVVMGSYKDLVLCCATKYNQRDYFICNPITKHWVALPPALRVYKRVEVAFVCDPYYCDAKPLRPAVVNATYIWKVVRLVPKNPKSHCGEFNVEIFSSKTRAWRKMVVLDPQLTIQVMYEGYHSAIAYKGMLYWYGMGGIILELDLDDRNYKKMKNKNKNINVKVNIARCRFIKLPKSADVEGLPYLVVSDGCIRLYKYVVCEPLIQGSLRAWELKDVVTEDRIGEFKFKWLVEEVPLSVQDENMYVYRSRADYGRFNVVDFHQQTVMYFHWRPYLATCHISESNRLEIITKIEYDGYCSNSYCSDSYRYLFPWWPTPVHL